MTPRRRHAVAAAPQVHLQVARLSWPGASTAQALALADALPDALGGLLRGAPPPVNHRASADQVAAAVAPQIVPALGSGRAR